MARSEQAEPQNIRYTRERIEQLLAGGAAAAYFDAIDSSVRLAYGERTVPLAGGGFDVVAADPADRINEKVDFERALVGAGLTEAQRAMGALLAMGWRLREIERVLHIDRRAIRRLLDDADGSPGLASRLEAFLNGGEAP